MSANGTPAIKPSYLKRLNYSKSYPYPKLPKNLRNKLKRIQNQSAAGGNRGVSGTVSPSQAIQIGKRFVGIGHRRMSNGKGLVSEDGLRIFRYPSSKTGTNPNTGLPWSKTGRQCNYETKPSPNAPPSNNVHLDVD